jgi:hypothetical protein
MTVVLTSNKEGGYLLEGILKEKNRPLSRQSSVLNSKASPGTRTSRPVLLNAGDDDPDDPPKDHEEMCPP